MRHLCVVVLVAGLLQSACGSSSESGGPIQHPVADGAVDSLQNDASQNAVADGPVVVVRKDAATDARVSTRLGGFIVTDERRMGVEATGAPGVSFAMTELSDPGAVQQVIVTPVTQAGAWTFGAVDVNDPSVMAPGLPLDSLPVDFRLDTCRSLDALSSCLWWQVGGGGQLTGAYIDSQPFSHYMSEGTGTIVITSCEAGATDLCVATASGTFEIVAGTFRIIGTFRVPLYRTVEL